jgi:hypothetical protein
MDNQFNTLLRSYHDNFLQHKLTGNPSYQQSYTAAQEGLDKIIDSLQSEVDSQSSQISEFYKSDVEEKMRETESQTRDTQRKIIKERDRIEAAKMRAQGLQVSASSTDMTSRYIAAGVLGAIALVLSFVR